jgi:hypothetical protein
MQSLLPLRMTMPGFSPDDAAYEARQIAQIRQWKGRRSGLVGRVLAKVTQPAGWVLRRIVPPGAVEGALRGGLWLADQWADQQRILRDLDAKEFRDLATHSLSRLDREADSVHNWAIAYGAGLGGAQGVVGLLAAPIGVPGVINVALRTIRKIGLCYGYQELDEAEKIFIFHVLALAGSHDQAEKTASLLALRELQVLIAKRTFKSMAEKAASDTFSKEALVIAIREFGKRIGIQMTRNRLLMAVPIAGGGVGLLLDGNYIRNVGHAARFSYQERWLRDRGRWPGDADFDAAVG